MAEHKEDKDGGPYAQHHTLGSAPNQASPGNHTHDGGSSVELELGGGGEQGIQGIQGIQGVQGIQGEPGTGEGGGGDSRPLWIARYDKYGWSPGAYYDCTWTYIMDLQPPETAATNVAKGQSIGSTADGRTAGPWVDSPGYYSGELILNGQFETDPGPILIIIGDFFQQYYTAYYSTYDSAWVLRVVATFTYHNFIAWYSEFNPGASTRVEFITSPSVDFIGSATLQLTKWADLDWS